MAKHRSIMNKYSFLWLAVVLLSFLSGCSDDDQPDAVEPYLRVVETASFENLSSAATTLTLKVESNVEWQITSEKPWCSFPVNNVQGDASVEVTIGENLTGETRSIGNNVCRWCFERRSTCITIGRSFCRELSL